MLISSAECSSEVSVRKKQIIRCCQVWINWFVTSVHFPAQRIPPCLSIYLHLWTPGAGRFCPKATGINYNQLIQTLCLPTLLHRGLENTWNDPQMWAHTLFKQSFSDYNFTLLLAVKMSAKVRGWEVGKKTGETSQKKSPTGFRSDRKKPSSSYFKIFGQNCYLFYSVSWWVFKNKIS